MRSLPVQQGRLSSHIPIAAKKDSLFLPLLALAVLLWLLSIPYVNARPSLSNGQKQLVIGGTLLLGAYIFLFFGLYAQQRYHKTLCNYQDLIADTHSVRAASTLYSAGLLFETVLAPMDRLRGGEIDLRYAMLERPLFINATPVARIVDIDHGEGPNALVCVVLLTDRVYSDDTYRIFSFDRNDLTKLRRYKKRQGADISLHLFNDEVNIRGDTTVARLVEYLSDAGPNPSSLISYGNLIALLYSNAIPVEHLCSIVALQDKIIYSQKHP